MNSPLADTPNDIENPSETWWRLLRYVGSYWPLFIVAVIGLLLDSAAQATFIYLLQPLIDEGFGSGADKGVATWIPAVMFGLIIVRVIGNFSGIYSMEWLGRKIVSRLRQGLFSQYLYLPKSYFDAHSSGNLVSRLTYNTDQVAHATTNGMITAVRDSMTVLGLIIVMFVHSPILSATLAILIPFVALIVGTISRRFRRISRSIQDSMGGLTHVTEEAVRGHAIIKLFAGQAYENQRFHQSNQSNRRLHQKLIATQLASSSLVQLLAGIALLVILFMATRQSFDMDITAGVFMSVISALVAMISPMKRLTNVHALIQKAIAAADSVFEVLDTVAEEDNGAYVTDATAGHIMLNDVSFHYPKRDELALQAINLDIQPGKVTALVGRSGSGKTTLVNLLTRFYPLTSGEITLDGRSLSDWQLSSLRSHMAWVGQDVVLFNDTLYNNIAYGGLALHTDEQVQLAIKQAHVDEFASELPQGLQTMIGDRGHLLSGGQRQRIALARALLKDAPILILDEATSALDNISERYIQRAIEKVIHNKTVIIIAHRLATIEQADTIVMLVKGRIAESGTHTELMARQGAYAALYQLQTNEAE